MKFNVLLIAEDTVKEQSSINENLFGKSIFPSIIYAQQMGLMPIIGECLYDKICGMVSEGTIAWDINVAYKDLLDDYIQPYLINKTIVELIPTINTKLVNFGVTLSKDEHLTNLDPKDVELLKNYYQERADFYQKRLQNFVKANKDAFPELTCDCEMTQPNLDSSNNSTGVWLGGFRGKKIKKNSCGCNTSSSEKSGDYDEGFRDGAAYQKSLLIDTAITENGSYTTENGFGNVEVNVAGGDINNQSKSVIITQNGSNTVTYDNGYTGLESVNINVNVNTGHSDAEMAEQYQSGYTTGYGDGREDGYDLGYDSGSTDGYNSGYTSGVTHQKSLLSAITINQNGDYIRENGYSAITVNVAGQAPSLTTTAITENGSYTPAGFDGFSSVEVNVPSTGYTEEEYVENYRLGWRQGQYFQKSLLTGLTVTENGTYTREHGYNRVVVNVPQTGYTEDDIINSYNSGYTDGYNDGYYDAHHVVVGDYLTLQIVSGGTLEFSSAKVYDWELQYKIDNGEWTYAASNALTRITVRTNSVVKLKANYINTPEKTKTIQNYLQIGVNGTATFNVSGNIMSLMYGDNYQENNGLDRYAFYGLFKDANVIEASGLTLPSEYLATGCYRDMFSGCTSLVSAPKLPSQNLKEECYHGMFQFCTNLTTAPDLLSIRLAKLCYGYMFHGCNKLNYIKCLAQNPYEDSTGCVTSWVWGVSTSGTFVKNPMFNRWLRTESGIPANWTVVNNI